MTVRMRNILRPMARLARLTGLNPGLMVANAMELPLYVRSLQKYSRLNSTPVFRIRLRNIYPILSDRVAPAGGGRGHYFHQDMWAARMIFDRRPASHLDIGSRIDGFVAHVLCFMPISVVDIRSMESDVAGLTFIQSDATELAGIASNSVESLSSLHAAEHFGLGRYSDDIDPTACFRFMKSLQRVLAPGGRLYFSVPIGEERVEFNANRVFAAKTILDCMSGLRLLSFSHVSEGGDLFSNTNPHEVSRGWNSCGLFEFTK